MENRSHGLQYVMIHLPRGTGLAAGAAGLLAAYARRRSGKEQWKLAAVDAFCGTGDTLLFARPVEIRLTGAAGAALPFLYKYFTE